MFSPAAVASKENHPLAALPEDVLNRTSGPDHPGN
jgi:hypothetical protein